MKEIIDLIIKQGVLPLFFHKDEKVSQKVMEVLYSTGIRALEYTNRGESAANNFKAMIEKRNRDFPDLKLGIGTVKNASQAEMFISLGADFIVSPGFVEEVAVYCKNLNILYIPGCMTPSEIIVAENIGIKFIKLFPGNILKPAFLSSIKDIFPDLLFMPTGGVDTSFDNIKSWYDAGVSALGMGSKLISKSLLEADKYDLISKDVKSVISIINELKVKK